MYFVHASTHGSACNVICFTPIKTSNLVELWHLWISRNHFLLTTNLIDYPPRMPITVLAATSSVKITQCQGRPDTHDLSSLRLLVGVVHMIITYSKADIFQQILFSVLW